MTSFWLLADLRYSLRSLLRAPGFAVAAILTLALGIGANTAIFTVADAVLLRPLPYPNSNRLVMIWNRLTKLGLERLQPESHSAEAYRRLDRIFDLSAGMNQLDRILTGDAGPERVPAMLVTDQAFPMLAPQASLGRLFSAEDYRAGAAPVAVIGYSLFQRRFSDDPAVLGKSIVVDGRSLRVIGVMSPSFDFSLRAGGIDVWTPKPDTAQSWGNSTRLLARLRPGVSIEAAQSALDAAALHVDETHHPYRGPHGEDAGYRVKAVSLHDQFLGEYRTLSLILLCAVAAVLLIACVNVANLLLVRAVAREKETIVRRALGATEGRLILQWITESAVLALLGGVLGAIGAVWAVAILVRLNPSALPSKLSVDGRALLFTLAISCIVCVLFGLAPALASTRLTWGARGVSRHNRRASAALVTIEVALAVTLMVSAGLLLKSFSRLRHVDPGFNPVHLLTMQVQFPPTVPQTNVRTIAFYSELREKLASLPGVISATVGGLPVRGGGANARGGDPFLLKGRAYDSDAGQFANLNTVGLDYFRTFEIPLRAGRLFAASDGPDAPRVVMINQTLARKFFPQRALGQQLGVPAPCRDSTCEPIWSTIIGVAADVKTVALDQPTLPMIYIPHAQQPFPGAGVIVRTAGEPLPLAHEVAAVVRSMNRDMPVFDIRTMEDRVEESIGQPRFEAVIVTFFAAAALFLAAIGIFGVVAHSTAQRTQEIGIRMALGADGARVVQTVLMDGLRPVVLGLLLGLAGALALSRVFSSLLFNVAATDPTTFLSAAVALTLVVAAACLIPARRATKVDPVVALREQ